MRSFNSFILQAKVLDLPLHGTSFTWFNNREVASWARLDRFLLSLWILSLFPKLIQYGLPRSVSDHNAIIIGEPNKDWGPCLFRFFNNWLEDNEVMRQACDGWKMCKVKGSYDFMLAAKIRSTKNHIKSFIHSRKKEFFSAKDYEIQIKALEKRVVCDGWSEEMRKEWKTIVEPSLVKDGIQDYFENHYKNVSCQRPNIFGLGPKFVSKNEKCSLERPFQEKEVREAICNCDDNKAPGPDDLNLNFVKANWAMIKEDLMRFIHSFLTKSSIVKDLNKTFITLIPKCGKPVSMKDFRPISLVGSMYKVLAKVLANRLKQVMDLVIVASLYDPGSMTRTVLNDGMKVIIGDGSKANFGTYREGIRSS
ncbi:hypothetical protein QYF36_004396 [Acer negundo]|nr:hypothetical protein QYF36_004396 [Acer negundo]